MRRRHLKQICNLAKLVARTNFQRMRKGKIWTTTGKSIDRGSGMQAWRSKRNDAGLRDANRLRTIRDRNFIESCERLSAKCQVTLSSSNAVCNHISSTMEQEVNDWAWPFPVF